MAPLRLGVSLFRSLAHAKARRAERSRRRGVWIRPIFCGSDRRGGPPQHRCALWPCRVPYFPRHYVTADPGSKRPAATGCTDAHAEAPRRTRANPSEPLDAPGCPSRGKPPRPPIHHNLPQLSALQELRVLAAEAGPRGCGSAAGLPVRGSSLGGKFLLIPTIVTTDNTPEPRRPANVTTVRHSYRRQTEGAAGLTCDHTPTSWRAWSLATGVVAGNRCRNTMGYASLT